MLDMLPFSMYGPLVGLLVAAAMANQPYPPVDAATGLDSYVERRSIELATTPAQWNAVWQRHKGITPIGNTKDTTFPSLEVPPSVDFDKDEVLVLFGGLANEGGYKVIDSQKTSKAIVVKIQPLPLLGNGASPSSYKANPYAFIMFQKTKLPFTIQVPAGADQSGTVQWRTIATVGGTSAANPGS